jgi:hypothetical protein
MAAELLRLAFMAGKFHHPIISVLQECKFHHMTVVAATSWHRPWRYFGTWSLLEYGKYWKRIVPRRWLPFYVPVTNCNIVYVFCATYFVHNVSATVMSDYSSRTGIFFLQRVGREGFTSVWRVGRYQERRSGCLVRICCQKRVIYLYHRPY